MSAKKININVKDITDKIAENYFVKKSWTYYGITLTDYEPLRKEVKRIKNHTIFFASLYGALGVILLYVPQYIFPSIFITSEYTVPYIEFTFEISILELIYGFVLVGFEIWLLMQGDLKTVGKIAASYGYRAKKNDIETLELVYIGLGKDQKKFNELGINPYQNFSRTGLFFLRVLFLIKAFLSNFIFRILLKKVLGRLAVRAVVDLAGIPIYALWNAYASSIIARKANMRMQALQQMNKTGTYFSEKYKDKTEFTDLLYDTFEFIAITKKSFHPTDFIFAKYFLDIFNVEIKDEHLLSEDYLEKVKKLPEDIKLAVGQLLILGFLLDGKIGGFEAGVLKRLIEENIIAYDLHDVKEWTKDYSLGKGFDKMFNYKQSD